MPRKKVVGKTPGWSDAADFQNKLLKIQEELRSLGSNAPAEVTPHLTMASVAIGKAKVFLRHWAGKGF